MIRSKLFVGIAAAAFALTQAGIPTFANSRSLRQPSGDDQQMKSTALCCNKPMRMARFAGPPSVHYMPE